MKHTAKYVVAMAGTIVIALYISSNPWVVAQSDMVPSRYNEYDIVVEESPDALADAVTDALRGGWQPVGGVALDDGRYVQAIGK